MKKLGAVTCLRRTTALALLASVSAAPALAETMLAEPSMNFYGVPGLMDMPSGLAAPDGEFVVGFSHFAGMTRATLSFQFTPWLGASFRYIGIEDWNSGGFDTYYDRNFDLRLRVMAETEFLPGVTVGLQDFAGTGLSSSEYIAATKTILPGLMVTGGLGWGRFGSAGAIGSTGSRPTETAETGGQFNYDQWFRGDFAPFAGIEWQPNDRLGLKLEYSSDAYLLEDDQRGIFDHGSRINIGAEYQLTDTLRVGGYYMYGSEVGLTFTFAGNPAKASPGTTEGGAYPVKPRPSPTAQPEAWSTSWVENGARKQKLAETLATVLKPDGILVEEVSMQANTATVRIQNTKLTNGPEAIGRTARAMTQLMPASIETFNVEPVVNGLPASRVTLRRSDLERLEYAPEGTSELRQLVSFSEAPKELPFGSIVPADLYPDFRWSFGPYLRFSFFDPEEPVRGETGLRLAADYEIMPGLSFSGSVSKRIVGNLDSVDRASNSELPHVRSDAWLYDKEGDPSLDRLQGMWVTNPLNAFYTRVNVGLLERMFGGVSTEVLWKPVDSRLGLGAELNWVQQRDFNLMFGFQDYDVITGHLSAYYEMGEGYLVQVDAGRYLAGDWGATLSLSREFANGWRVGAYATKTDVSAEQFGEGSFDKGIRVEIPLDRMLGQPTREKYATTIQPLTRDGGARLNVSGRLYEQVRQYHEERLDQQWDRVWR